MKTVKNKMLLMYILLLAIYTSAFSQNNGVTTYMNPIMGDHADMTLMRDGDDFYNAGSSFHYNPFIPIYHSTDLVHWEVIARVVPSNWSALSSDAPSNGTWQGALAKFGGYYWLYFSNHTSGGQYFCKATDMKGPWSAPTRVQGSSITGYDNSVFVDDDGTPYLIMKNGAKINRIQKLDPNTGHASGAVMNLDWLNAAEEYGMAEGPVMCKKNGRYYYFFAGHVFGGQWVISSPTLTANQSSWTSPQTFFKGTATLPGFNAPNHMSQPIELDDGTWWCVAHAYGQTGWNGQGRICLLYQVKWNGDTPYADQASSSPVTAPNLPNPNNIGLNFPREDYFSSTTLALPWHFFNVANSTKYSLSEKPGFMRLKPGGGTTHVLQKEAGRAYTLTTKVTVNATGSGQHAGLRLQNGNDAIQVRLYVSNGKIGFAYNGSQTEVNNNIGNTVYLRIDRDQHNVNGYYSADGKTWNQVGSTYSTTSLDNSGESYNYWVGNSLGLYATGINADFDFFKYRDASIPLGVTGHNNHNGVSASGNAVTNTTNGGFFMLAGVSTSEENTPSSKIVVNAASASGGGELEVWIDNISGAGTKIATLPIGSSGGSTSFKDYIANVNVSGQHDLYLKYIGSAGIFSVRSVQFLVDEGAPFVTITAPNSNEAVEVNTQVTISADASDSDGSVTKVEFYEGTNLIGTATTSPYSISWTPTSTGTYSITAKATDNDQKVSSSSAVSVKVNPKQEPYGGSPHPIPGKIECENYDIGGNGSAYYDVDAGTNVDPAPNFRTDEDVDIETCTDDGDGYNLGWTAAGEWYEYTVDVANAGIYNLIIRAACNGDDRTISFDMDGEPVTRDVAIPNTGGWQLWEDITVNDVELKAGVQVLRLSIGAVDYVNLNYLIFQSSKTAPVVAITSPANASEFDDSETVNINVTATSEGSTISSVSVFVDGNLFESVNSAPYSFDWSAMSVGSHEIIAEAVDADNMKASDTITVSIIAAPVKIQLKAGWNIIGYPYSSSASIESALSGIWSYVEIIKDFNGFYDKISQPSLNSLNELVYGRGYYLKVNANCELIWQKP